MKEGPDIARIAALIGDPARASILSALMSGCALTASELAHEAGVTAQTASSHLAKLQDGGLIVPTRQGRYRYFQIAGPEVASAIEALMGLASRAGCLRTRPGPKEPALRHARVCYDHLAGDRGVEMFDAFERRGWLRAQRNDRLGLTTQGKRFFEELGIDVDALETARRPMCRACLDWSARRSHLAGGLGAALLTRFCELKWTRREQGRVIRFSRAGERSFAALLGRTRQANGMKC